MNIKSLKAYTNMINMLWESVGKKEMNEDITFIFNKSGYGKENWELQQRINKAIKYIEPKMINEYIHTDYIYTLLDILKGCDTDDSNSNNN